MTDMVVGFPFAPKQYRANYVCLEMRGGSFFLLFFVTIWESHLLNRISLMRHIKRGMRRGVGSEWRSTVWEREKWQMTDKFIQAYVHTHVDIWSKKIALSHTCPPKLKLKSNACVEVCVLSISFARFHQDLMRNLYLPRALYLKAQPILMRIFLVTFHSYTFTQRKIFV